MRRLWAFVGRIDWSWVRKVAASRVLPVWFIAMTGVYLIERTTFPMGIQPGTDARIYLRATEAWLAGGNPYAAGYFGLYFGAPPPTLLVIAPFTMIGETLAVAIWLIGGVALTLWTLRRLGLPFWWMFWPPLVEAEWTASPNTTVLALLVLGGTAPGILAVLTKAFAGLPLLLLHRWRPLVGTGVIVIITAPFLPWLVYVNEGPQIVVSQIVGYSATSQPYLLIPTLIAVFVLGRDRMPWLAVPAFWPLTQVNYGILALPAMAPILGAFMAIREPWALPVGLIAYAAWERLRPTSP